MPELRDQSCADPTGWRCDECGWETFDLEVMRNEVNWPDSKGVSLVCPGCGAEGKFVDAVRGHQHVWARLSGRRWCPRCGADGGPWEAQHG